ncbi:MAG: plasma membrane localization protein [Watsoniomyces obsoletus]|nr:MAG: plasma membrane localization protein [Watsoniomyces obsoletus]
MPRNRRVTVGLISQFGAKELPEYAPGSGPPFPAPPGCGPPSSIPPESAILRGSFALAFSRPSDPEWPKSSPPPSRTSVNEPTCLIDRNANIVSVYVPAYPHSRFWVQYVIEDEPKTSKACYFFKLFVNQDHVVSWGVSKKEKFAGKTMFALSMSPQDHSGGEVERKTFHLGGPITQETISGSPFSDPTMLQILVYRAYGRKRAEADSPSMYGMLADASSLPNHNPSLNQNEGINFRGAGMHCENDQFKFYRYALVDPLDDPYVTFRYYFRSWDQIRDLGVRPLSELLHRPRSPPARRRKRKSHTDKGKSRADEDNTPASNPESTPTRSSRSGTPVTPSSGESTPRASSMNPSPRGSLNTAHPLGTPIALPEEIPGMAITAPASEDTPGMAITTSEPVGNHAVSIPVARPESMPGLTATAPPSTRDYTGAPAENPIGWFQFLTLDDVVEDGNGQGGDTGGFI